MKKITEKAYAKINLHLDITSKYPDGYHGVNTVMQTVSLCDDVSISMNDTGSISLLCDAPGIPCDGKNIAWRAAELFFDRLGLTYGAEIEIVKRIPSPAGLAGGSADAAAVLRGLNTLCEAPMSTEQLCELGALLGADVPFCIVGGTCFADGRGDILHMLPPMPDCAVVIACEGEGVSTPWAYGELDRIYDSFKPDEYLPRDMSGVIRTLENSDLRGMAGEIFNIFEVPVLSKRPVAAKIRKFFLENGALGAMMSGSGPAVFALFENDADAEAVAEKSDFRSFICRPVRRIISL